MFISIWNKVIVILLIIIIIIIIIVVVTFFKQRGPGAGVSLWILKNWPEHRFLQNTFKQLLLKLSPSEVVTKQELLSEGTLRNSCSEKFHNVPTKNCYNGPFFDEIVGLRVCLPLIVENFPEKSFPVKVLNM